MAIHYLILLSRQGKVRLAKWFTTLSPKEKAKIIKDVTQLVLSRRTRMCNFLEYKDTKVVYRRYASLFFIAGCASTDNELITLEVVHRYVEQMDKYYGNVCELDIIFNFQKAYFILDELLLAGEMQESSKKNVLRCISQQDSLEDVEVSLVPPGLCLYFVFTYIAANMGFEHVNSQIIHFPPIIGRPSTVYPPLGLGHTLVAMPILSQA
ncbi:AP-1 complex subunit sigma [Aspergillus clavatus NRRL 1]|uniref:AP-1 complex subunit sigma-1 n=1 Tax=Aspergillus clavatus (strain ATCC 1007 / CBS 513.65 / DSM 816 / NCTC 3887 / NRRL 1 / QM 1276 / 107) TaxID=344612 RepID=A1CFI9_ASPCL|nr:clathrin coat assembly protein ap19 [Aspergillus clavatus NRRL 1]EAW11638.1 clathrin coat assembly protein ap19 [Aspergillus clavatus NRRL 1]